ncbi:MAG: MFS transporter [Coriobacteriia bacterium]|nr:MFS transporter [Coriobacteriia bacterium]
MEHDFKRNTPNEINKKTLTRARLEAAELSEAELDSTELTEAELAKAELPAADSIDTDLAAEDVTDTELAAEDAIGTELKAGESSAPELTAAGTQVPDGWFRTVAIVFSGQLFSLITTASAGFALIWFLTQTGSAMILVLGTVCFLLPMAVLSPIIGSFVDRNNRKHIMMLANIYNVVLTVVMIGLILIGLASVPLVLSMIALRSVGQIFHMTAMNAAIPLLVPNKHLVRVSSVVSGLGAASSIIGPAIGISLFEIVGLQNALAIDIAGSLIACAVLLFVVIPAGEMKKEERTKVLRELKDGIAAIREKAGMTPFFATVAVACVFFMPMAALFPLLTVQHFNGGGFEVAIIEAIWGTCFLAGTAVLGVWGGGKRLTFLIRCCLGICGLIVLAIGLLPSDGFWWFFGLTGLMAVFGVLFDTPLLAVIQRNIEPEKLGRVLAAFNSLTSLASLIGLGFAGLVGDVIGVAPIFVISGIGMFLVACTAFSFASINKLDLKAKEEEEVEARESA